MPRVSNFYADFGPEHPFREFYAEIQAETWIQAQDMATQAFGHRWRDMQRENLERFQADGKRKGFVITWANGVTIGLPFAQPEYEP